MSIIVSDLSFHYSSDFLLLNAIRFTVEEQTKMSLIGENGSGKSSLLKLLAGQLVPCGGTVTCSSTPYYIPQHTGKNGKSIAQILRIEKKRAALHAIEQGSVLQSDYDILNDDWDIEARCHSALSFWQLPYLDLDMPADDLSGGELTKVYLAGLLIHSPDIILLDEPTNHLDGTARNLLYQFIRQSKATFVIVSHDITLLNQLNTTLELTSAGIHVYGGNYTFYKAQKEIHTQALQESIHDREKSIRTARKLAAEVKQRQEKRTAVQGEKNKSQVPRALRNKLRQSSEETAARLKEAHQGILQRTQAELRELKKQRELLKELKPDFDNTTLHPGKLLVEACKINFSWPFQNNLWEDPLTFTIHSHDRIHIQGDNGSGKTTLIQLLLGELSPSEGIIRRQEFNGIYLDQNYSILDADCSIEELARQFNTVGLEDHEIKLRLNRFLFPSNFWNKRCRDLSGGEKMRLYLCCLMIRNQTPDLIVLDEPTNNLDIQNLRILTHTLRNYKGSLLVVSHDAHFVNEIQPDREWCLNSFLNKRLY